MAIRTCKEPAQHTCETTLQDPVIQANEESSHQNSTAKLIPAHRRLRWEDREFKVSLGLQSKTLSPKKNQAPPTGQWPSQTDACNPSYLGG
jgi:hypothetical protein